MVYGTVDYMGNLKIDDVVGLPARISKFIGKSIALPANKLAYGAKVKASVAIEDRRPYVVDYTEIKDVTFD